MASTHPPAPISDAAIHPQVAPLWRNVVAGLVIASLVTAQIGAAFAPSLIVDHPLGMLALNANNRYLLLVTNQLGAVEFYTVAGLRRATPSISFFLVGYWYGQRAIAWLESRDPGSGAFVRTAQRLFERASWVVVAAAPTPVITLLAGAARMRPARVVPLIVVSIAARIVVLRLAGAALSEPVEAIVDWIDRWRLPLLAVTIGSVAITAWSQRKLRVQSIEELTKLDD